MSLSAGDYRPRDAEHAVLYRVIDEHLDAFLESAPRHADVASLPAFVEREFREFLTCGVLAHGFARLRCTDCALERLVPFSFPWSARQSRQNIGLTRRLSAL